MGLFPSLYAIKLTKLKLSKKNRQRTNAGFLSNISAQYLRLGGSLINNCMTVTTGKSALNWTINNLHKRFQIQWKKPWIETIATNNMYCELPPCQLLQWGIQNGVMPITLETLYDIYHSEPQYRPKSIEPSISTSWDYYKDSGSAYKYWSPCALHVPFC